MILVFLSSCFTGVESTKKITLSKEDRKAIRLTEEDSFLKSIQPSPLSEWEKGMPFYATDNRVILIFDQQGLPTNPEEAQMKGKILTYGGCDSHIGADGKKYTDIIFQDGEQIYRYNTNKTEKEASSTVMSDKIPMLIDMNMVQQAAGLMKGKKLWTRTALWYDTEGNKIKGKKFIPVHVQEVKPGSMVFPLMVMFKDEEDNNAALFINFGNSGTDSRSFSHIFTLEDIRKKYPSTTDEIWNLISTEQVRKGMTKEECRLSLGVPTEVSSGHDYSQTLDLWHYPDGMVLWFEDGLLSRFRK